MRCEDVQPLLSDHLDGTLPAAEAAGVDLHLAGCEACRAERDDLSAVVDMLRAVPMEAMPAGLLDRISAVLADEPAPTMGCDEAQDLLTDRREGTLDEDEAPLLATHLAGCADCRRVAAELDAVVDLLRRIPQEEVPADLSAKVSQALGAPSIGCDEASDYLAIEPDAWEGRALAAHLEGCAPCRRKQAELDAVVALLRRVPPEPLPADLLPRITAALAAEPGSGVVVPFARPEPRRRAWPHWASSVAGAAAACAVFALWTFVPGLGGVPRIETAAVSVQQDVAVNIGFDAEQSVDGVIFQVDLPDGLKFIDDKAQPMLAQSVSWKGSLAQGKTVVPITVRGIRPGRYEIEAYVRKGPLMRKTTITLPVQG